MAEKLDSLESFLSCQVCFEDFEKDGKRVPRILPCSHTLCESCIKQLIQNSSLECPYCRKTHEADNSEKSFPQNRYLLIQIKREGTKEIRDENGGSDCKRCEEHGKELDLFCREPGCQKHICVSCFEQHKNHDIQNISEDMGNNLIHEIDILMKNFESRIKLGSDLKKDISIKTEECVRKIVRKKDELFDHINNMIAEAERKEKETTDHVDDAVSNMNEKLALLCNMKQELKDINSEKLTKHQETLRMVAQHKTQDLTDTELFWYPEFTVGRAPVEDAVGALTEITSLTSKQKNIAWALNENSMELKATKIVDGENIKCTGKATSLEGLFILGEMLVLVCNALLLCVRFTCF